ncbi:hypothetical protein [Alteromonas stellipolaris]|uniref:hypothetical protein n=1 Tax=Alteromonas stellipolaris TaxID=233316 RepID=UPI001DE53D7B|nr:hypothetical protein [Alteromonas stellipolaris]MBZ2164161.1 hypothetical protein [Alteromonas stellipolaris]
MIKESSYWKEPLLALAKDLRVLNTKSKIKEYDFVQVEKDVLIGFYSIRKLFDTPKVSDEIKQKKYRVHWHSHVGEKLDFLKNHRLDELFDFSKTNTEQRYLRDICNWFIHSYIFELEYDSEGKISGILFTPDKDKNRKIYSLPIEQVTQFFEDVGSNYPEQVTWRRGEEDGDETFEVL